MSIFMLLILTLYYWCNSKDDTFEKGIDRYNVGDLNGAAKEFRKAIEVDPEMYKAYSWLGLVEYERNNCILAVSYYSKAKDLIEKPGFGLYVRKGIAEMDCGLYIQAIETIDEGINNYPKSGVLHKMRGDVKYECNDYKGALSDYDIAIEIYSDYADAYYSRSRVRRELGDNEGAEKDLEMARKL